MSRSPFTWGTRILAAGALLFTLLLGGGALLPGTWEATATRVLPHERAEVWALVDGPDGWRRWTAWPEVGVETEGPARGEGARLVWDHPDMGDGVFEITQAHPPGHLAYTVLVEEGALRTQGDMTLEAVEGGTRVTWREEGDFGWNPLMGYWALAMERVQGRELAKGLDRLEAEVAAGGADGPAPDSAAASPAPPDSAATP